MLILDVETTTFKKGNPFSERNRLCLVGVRSDNESHIFDIGYSGLPMAPAIRGIQDCIDRDPYLCGFNIKFDLHWLRRIGVDTSRVRIWDCQLFEFLRTNQTAPFPSLDDAGLYYGAGLKDDRVEQYWAAGVDTDRIPLQVLTEYLEGDLDLTYKVYLAQKELAKSWSPQKRNLFKLQCADLLVLADMEYNGTKLNIEGLQQAAHDTQTDLDKIETELEHWTLGFPHFNFDSVDHVSCLLYGGVVTVDVATPYDHTYKSGPKAGRTEIRQRWSTQSQIYPRLVEPLEGSELKKEGYWSTDDKWLGKLSNKREVKELVSLLRTRSELEKRLSTYYVGLPELIREMDWASGFLHGQLNQCVVITGRLSSSKPNMQNFDKGVNEYIVTRF